MTQTLITFRPDKLPERLQALSEHTLIIRSDVPASAAERLAALHGMLMDLGLPGWINWRLALAAMEVSTLELEERHAR